ncbi:hypothetical protein WKK05_04355 [Nostoc sp. UHCC 0302]|uniref:hypothetical protein n=1 Tax=Nostoc sp. UHCC 0302 TaxID=3134896 RepID=UPI00311C9611
MNDANVQDEAMAELLELANSRQISLNQLREELKQFRHKFDKLNQLIEKFISQLEQGELIVLLCVRYNFLLKEIIDNYWYFLEKKNCIEFIKNQTLNSVAAYKDLKSKTSSGSSQEDDNYIIVETLKHVIQSCIKASFQINALSKEEVNALHLGDITPQETETMLTSLASTKKWDWVYRNLA